MLNHFSGRFQLCNELTVCSSNKRSKEQSHSFEMSRGAFIFILAQLMTWIVFLQGLCYIKTECVHVWCWKLKVWDELDPSFNCGNIFERIKCHDISCLIHFQWQMLSLNMAKVSVYEVNICTNNPCEPLTLCFKQF